jgi:hypothetical protein
VPSSGSDPGKAFFLEGKNQKTFVNWGRAFDQVGLMVKMRRERRFLLLFFKKAALSSLP